jgi:ABC-type iron transport system FetAB permease component
MMARATVIIRPQTASTFLPAVMAWCAYVTVAREHNKIIVFNKGIALASNASIPLGGQIFPIASVGARLAAKNAQKKAKKNITSDTMNRIVP